MSKTAGHTPTPWSFWFDTDGDHAIAGADGLLLAVTVGVDDLPKEVDEANAALIVSAVNSHEALREALRQLIPLVKEDCHTMSNRLHDKLVAAEKALALAEEQ